MGLFGFNLRSPFYYERNKNGDHWYEIGNGDTNWELGDKLDAMLKNPVTFRCVDLISDLFSQVKFQVDGEDVENDELINSLNNPNEFQSKQDFLREYLFFKYAYGWVYQKPLKGVGSMQGNVIYNLNPCNVEYQKDSFPTRLIFGSKDARETKERQFRYEEDSQKHFFQVSDIIPFFDIANGLSDDFLLKAPSRLDAIQKEIRNMGTARDAEFNALGKAGTFLLSASQKGSMVNKPLEQEEKKDMERRASGYGLGRNKGNIIITQANLDVNSLHTPMNQLGIKETISDNALTIINTFGVPRELYSLDASGATYENQKSAMLNLIQNGVQNQIDDYCNSYNSHFKREGKNRITGTLSHLPTMQLVEDMKADRALKISATIKNIQQAGLNPTEVLESLGIVLEA